MKRHRGHSDYHVEPVICEKCGPVLKWKTWYRDEEETKPWLSGRFVRWCQHDFACVACVRGGEPQLVNPKKARAGQDLQNKHVFIAFSADCFPTHLKTSDLGVYIPVTATMEHAFAKLTIATDLRENPIHSVRISVAEPTIPWNIFSREVKSCSIRSDSRRPGSWKIVRDMSLGVARVHDVCRKSCRTSSTGHWWFQLLRRRIRGRRPPALVEFEGRV